MSGHADTIHAALRDRLSDEAIAFIDALLAENQRLREALKKVRWADGEEIDRIAAEALRSGQ